MEKAKAYLENRERIDRVLGTIYLFEDAQEVIEIAYLEGMLKGISKYDNAGAEEMILKINNRIKQLSE